MLALKYIIYRPWHGTAAEDYPILFPPSILHADFNNSFCSDKLEQPIAAGMCIVSGERLVCKGGSESMDLAGREEVDAEIIRRTAAL